MWHAVRFAALESLGTSISKILLAGVCFGLMRFGGVAVAELSQINNTLVFGYPRCGASSGFNTLSRKKDQRFERELGERHFNWIREVNRQRKSEEMRKGWEAAGGPQFPRTRRSEDIFTYAEPSMGMYLCIFVSAKCTRRQAQANKLSLSLNKKKRSKEAKWANRVNNNEERGNGYFGERVSFKRQGISR